MTDDQPKSSEEMIREANSRLRAPQDPVPEPAHSVRPSPPPPEAPRQVEEVEESDALEFEAEPEYLSPDHDPMTEPYSPVPSGRPARGSRLAALALRFWLGIVVFAGIGFFSSLNDANRDGSGELVSAGYLDVMALQVGDCFDDPDDPDELDELDEVVFDVAAVPCTEAHDNEVYSLVPVTVFGTAFPGEAALQDFSYEACVGAPFREYVGADYLDSALEVFTFTPTEESWDGGDRDVVCILYKLDLTKLIGTARGSGL
ncbi:MAG: septum formation family protein [Acidimicrobiia bacterium]